MKIKFHVKYSVLSKKMQLYEPFVIIFFSLLNVTFSKKWITSKDVHVKNQVHLAGKKTRFKNFDVKIFKISF